jgi:hypothetical protein
LKLRVRTWAVYADAERRRPLRRAPHFDLDLMGPVVSKGVTGMEGYTWNGTVMDTNGGIGTHVFTRTSAAAILGSAERLMLNVGRAGPMEPAGGPLKLARRRRLLRAEACAAARPRLEIYNAPMLQTALARHDRRRDASWSSAGTLGPQRGARIANDDRPLRRS